MSSSLLCWRLRQLGTPIQVVPPDLRFDRRDELALLRISSGTPRLVFERGSTGLRPTPELLRRATNEAALYVCDLQAGLDAGHGDIVPFAPPRAGALGVALPVVVPEARAASLRDIGLRLGRDLAREDVLQFEDLRVAVLGIPTLAALDATHARSITWWRRDGSAVHLKVVVESSRVSLRFEEVFVARDADRAPCGPNMLLRIGPDARLVLESNPTVPAADRSRVEALLPPRSDLFETWARYASVARREEAAREGARGKHPIRFSKGRQEGSGWRAETAMDPEAVAAWLGEPREGREERIGQPVAIRDVDGAPLDLRAAVVRGPGQIDLFLEQARGAAPLPEHGVLEVRTNRGSVVKREREREASERLMAGAAACPRLLDILLEPGNATPPDLTVRPPAVAELDVHQRGAVEMILGCRDLVVIQGPPGTGKTRVIVEALRRIGSLRTGAEPIKVLVSSVQNEAVANVVERLGPTQGVLVKLVTRRARDDSEDVEFARRRRETLEGVLARLRSRAAADGVADRLQPVRDTRAGLAVLRRDAALSEPAWNRVASTLLGIADDPESILGLTLRDDARTLAARLSATSESDPDPPPPFEAGTPPIPTSPEQLPAWWAEASSSVPAAERASLGADVSLVLRALEAPPPRRARKLARLWPELGQRLATSFASAGGSTPRRPTSHTEPRSAALVRWIARALAEVLRFEASVRHTPGGIAHAFAEALEDDPRAWDQLVDRYGPTVAATCSMSARASDDPGSAFDWVIIDEAGRASPFELLVPMVQGRRVVLIGDHRQLPPMIDRAIEREAEREGRLPADLEAETLFGALYNSAPSACRTRLAVQYRMHESIGGLVNDLFYAPHGEHLENWFRGARRAERAPRWGVFDNLPLVWANVPRRRQASVYRNDREIDVVIALLSAFVKGGAGPGTVGVICPYTVQRKQLLSRLAGHHAEAAVAQVRTFDAVQGREWPAVIVCMTRDDGAAGFLSSPNRVNVAISRAQRQLIIVGARNVFASSERVRTNARHLADLAKRVSTNEVSR